MEKFLKRIVMKNTIKIILGIVLLATVVVVASSPSRSEANVFESFYEFLRDAFVASTSTDVAVPEKQEPVSLYKPVLDYEEAVTGAVERAEDSVVSVVISKDLPVIEQCPQSPFADLPPEFQDFFGDQFQFYAPCEKGTELREVGGGSGFVVSEDGLIVTNRHVVLDEEAEYTVLTNQGDTYEAEVLARDPLNDLAVLKVEASDLIPATLGNSDTLKLGQTAIAIGNALGEFRNTVSVGVISGLARTITASGGGGFVERIEGVIQTDAAINEGNSGGPLLNLKGEVVGINTAIVSGAQNIGFAIPINEVKRAIESVKETGSIKIPFLGVRYTMLNEDIAEDQGLSVSYGALIRGSQDGPGVIPGSPAEEAGLEAEDVILEMNGESLTESNSLARVIRQYGIGDTVTLTVLRDGGEIDIPVRLGERPEEE